MNIKQIDYKELYENQCDTLKKFKEILREMRDNSEASKSESSNLFVPLLDVILEGMRLRDL